MYKALCKECSSPVIIDNEVKEYRCTGCGKTFPVTDDEYTKRVRNISLEMRERIAFNELLKQLDKVKIITDFEIGERRTLKRYTGNDKVIEIPRGVIKIGTDAFARNDSIEKVIFSDSVRIIDVGAFMWCRNLREVFFNGKETRINNEAFMQCHSLGEVNIPQTVKSIGDSAFYRCGSIESVIIPSSVENIGEGAFAGCGKLKDIIIEDGNITVGHKAFALNESLEYVRMYPGKKVIFNDAFFGCGSFNMDMNCEVLFTTEDFYRRFGM
ncbi:MAG: leucine-rich repeat domain-containing protein [Anaerofustis stercorihominis]|nr:leucine-rich repeat domain-containing protein [Anaerofustis stercorihominis]